MNRCGNVPVTLHDFFCGQDRSNRFRRQSEGFILSIDQDSCQNNCSAFRTMAMFENAVQLERECVPNHALCGSDPFVHCMRNLTIHRHQFTDLRAVPMREYNRPTRLKQIHNIAHDLGKDQCMFAIIGGAWWSQSIPSNCVDNDFAHVCSLLGSCLMLSPFCWNNTPFP